MYSTNYVILSLSRVLLKILNTSMYVHVNCMYDYSTHIRTTLTTLVPYYLVLLVRLITVRVDYGC